jgi:hypothetical protein
MGETSGEYVPIKTLQYSTLSLNLTLFSCFEPEQDERSYHAGDRFPLIVHEMGHFMQHCYASITGNCTWTDEAASCYYEWKTGGDVQETLELGKETVFQSVYPQKDDQNSGYGRMPLFQYLEEYRKPGFIHSLYTGTTGGYGGNDDWCAAITALCGDPKSYASDYYHKLLTRELAGERGTYSLSARDIYRAIAEQWPDGPSLGLAAGLALPAEGESLNTVFSSGADSIVLGQYSFTVESTGAQFLALNVTGGMVPEGAELWVYGSGNCSVSAYCCQNYNARVLPGNGTSVDLRSFAEDTARGCIYLIQMVALQDSGAFSDNNTYTLSVMLSTNELLDATPGINHDDPNNGPTETSPAPSGSIPSASPAMTSDLLADAMPESAGDRFDRFAEPVPNARSGSICTEPSMRIDAFNIIGGRLVRPEITNAQNETFTYINEGYCNAGETIGLQMIASARDREQDNIEYNILENQLTMKITFYDENGNLIGTPAEQQSPEDGKEHSIGDTISAVVPENAVSVTIQGSFVHFYGSYGDYHSASVGISVNFRVCQEEVQSSAVDTELIDTSGFGSEDADETEDCEQFWTSMNGYWMCYNAVGEVEYFQFARESDGRKALLVGTVETGRAEPSEAISVSRHSDTVYEVIYRYDGVDYYLYFDGSQLDSGVILYAANRPEGYRAFDFTGTTIEDAQAYYDAYYQ